MKGTVLLQCKSGIWIGNNEGMVCMQVKLQAGLQMRARWAFFAGNREEIVHVSGKARVPL